MRAIAATVASTRPSCCRRYAMATGLTPNSSARSLTSRTLAEAALNEPLRHQQTRREVVGHQLGPALAAQQRRPRTQVTDALVVNDVLGLVHEAEAPSHARFGAVEDDQPARLVPVGEAGHRQVAAQLHLRVRQRSHVNVAPTFSDCRTPPGTGHRVVVRLDRRSPSAVGRAHSLCTTSGPVRGRSRSVRARDDRRASRTWMPTVRPG